MTFRDLVHRMRRRQEGAYLVEFLAGLSASLLVMLLVFQLVFVMIIATLVNNALQSTAQEASVQGGLNNQACLVWRGTLPDYIWTRATVSRDGTAARCSQTPGAAPAVGDRSRRGREATRFGDPINLSVSYDLPTPFLRGFQRVFPPPPPQSPNPGFITMRRSVMVSSQAAKEN